MREVLGGGSGGRYYADGEDTIHVVPDSRNLPDRVHRVRGSRSSSSGSAWPWTPVGRGSSAAASATTSTSGCSRTPTSCRSPTARSSPAGACKAAGPGGRSRSRSTPADRTSATVDALADAEPVRAGEVIRIRTTGGGGWGDPLDRDPRRGRPRRARGARSPREGARDDYGVVLTGSLDDDSLGYDDAATSARARQLAGPRASAFFDRGPGYARLAGGATYAEVDAAAMTRERLTVVTGGGRGIGAATALRLAADGHDLVLGYVRDVGAADDHRRAGARARRGLSAVRADVTDAHQVDRAVRRRGRGRPVTGSSTTPARRCTSATSSTPRSRSSGGSSTST